MEQMYNQQPGNGNGGGGLSTALGIVSLIVAIVGGITFGIIGAGIAIVLGIVAIVLGINAKKATNGAAGTGGFVCGIIGVVFAVIFAAGCAICGAAESSSIGTKGYTCYGLIGGSCMVGDDVEDLDEELEELQKDLEDYYN